MADFNITINSKESFYVDPFSQISTDCASIFDYYIYSSVGDLINISVIGNPVNLYYRVDGIIYPFTNLVEGIIFDTTIFLQFILVNSGSAGAFNFASINITNTTTGDSFSDLVNRLDDSKPCTILPFSTGLTVDSTLITVDSTLITADNG